MREQLFESKRFNNAISYSQKRCLQSPLDNWDQFLQIYMKIFVYGIVDDVI